MVDILMNTSMIDEAWCFPILRRYIKPNMKVCVVALSFFDDTKTQADWNKQYQKGSGSGIAPITMSFLNTGSRMKIFLGSIIFKTRRKR